MLQINQILAQNEWLKNSNSELNKKLEDIYKEQIAKRKSSIGAQKSIDHLCDSVEKVRISQDKKKSLLDKEIGENYDHGDMLEQLDNF